MGQLGTAFLLLEEVLVVDPVAIEPDSIPNMEAVEMAKWAVDPNEHVVKRMLGIATMNAIASSEQDLSNGKKVDAATLVDIKPSDTIGVIGWIRHLVQTAGKKAQKVIVFDNAEADFVYPPETQDELLPTCDVVFISGTSFINQSIDHILSICQNAHDIIIAGPTTPMFPNAYRDTNVTIIAVGVWKREDE